MQQQFSDNKTDQSFRDKLSGLRVEPRSRVWYRISSGLDREAAIRAHHKRKVIGVSIGILIVIGIGLTMILDPVATKKTVSNSAGQIVDNSLKSKKITRSSQNTVPFQQDYSVDKNKSQPSNFYSPISVSKISFPTILNSEILPDLISAENLNSIVNLRMIPSMLNYSDQNAKAEKFENLILCTYETVTIENKINSTDINCNNKLYVGANIKFSRTSFVDTALDQNTNFIDKFQMQKAISIYTGYKFNKNLSAELGWTIFSDEGQSYGYTSVSRNRGAIPTRKDYQISLRYTQIPLKVRYGVQCWSGILKTHVTFSLALGALYGKLVRSGFTIGDMDVSSHLKKSEIAGIGDLNIDFKVLKHVSFSAGFEASYSNNILLPNKKLSPFTAPHNLVIGTSVGLKYNFCRNN